MKKLIDGIKKLFSQHTLRKRLIFFFAFPIIVFVFMIIMVFVYNDYVVNEHKKILDKLYFFNEIAVDFNNINNDIEKNLIQTYGADNSVLTELGRLDSISGAISRYADEIYYSNNWSQVEGLAGMIETYHDNTESILVKIAADEPYYEALLYNRDVTSFINTRLDTLISGYLIDSAVLFEQINKTSDRLQMVIIITICMLIIMLMLFAYRFSKRMSIPIKQLSLNAELVAKGNLEVTPVCAQSKDEVHILAESFNEMVMEIKQLIEKIVDQSVLESKLKEEEMKNLKNINLLREAEIKMLQSQIDPHFLFNTLNIISRTSILENAEMTSKLILTTAKLLRYNMEIRKRKESALRDEINNIKEYLLIYKVRFPEKFQYRFEVDDSLCSISVPYLFLQPIVENAIIHGLEPMNEQGLLVIRVFQSVEDRKRSIIIEVSDNGFGMDGSAIEMVLSGEKQTGTGINNVKKRLEYFYETKDILTILKNQPKGITVKIVIPMKKSTIVNTEGE